MEQSYFLNEVKEFNRNLVLPDVVLKYDAGGFFHNAWDVEIKTHYEFNVAGISKENISIAQDGEYLSIEGSQPNTDRKISENIYLGHFDKIEEVKCKYDNGLLIIDIIEKEKKPVKITF